MYTVDVLTDDTWNLVFLHCPINSVARMARVCRYFKQLLADDGYWRSRCFQEFPEESALSDPSTDPTYTSWRDMYRLKFDWDFLIGTWDQAWFDVNMAKSFVFERVGGHSLPAMRATSAVLIPEATKSIRVGGRILLCFDAQYSSGWRFTFFIERPSLTYVTKEPAETASRQAKAIKQRKLCPFYTFRHRDRTLYTGYVHCGSKKPSKADKTVTTLERYQLCYNYLPPDELIAIGNRHLDNDKVLPST
eukprot:TRINITY_DN13184_c0_g1_i1.p1 TRINITY_DN13184_c0_g1~~TRINITY_DN13184_c0_g1_i1.p1  ORF type:complete len:265 (-),score=17.16 TRINITY_DN13184_c0_g1_i1:47-790(-)